MNTLRVALKNGKRLETKPAPFVQLMEWRNQLVSERATVVLPTLNGRMRVDGRSVHSVHIDQDIFTTEEAASGMRFEPYTHYTDGSNTYQYSLHTRTFERATVRCGIVYWEIDCLPEGVWTRIGHDSFLNHRQLIHS